MPTEACNFRCAYCYETFALKRMTPSLVSGVKRLIERRAPRASRMQLSWFGGEPLLVPDILEEVGAHARRICQANDVPFTSDCTTNGYLLSADRLSALPRAGIELLHISLDGDKHAHDETRVLASGKGTFDMIWRNLEAIADSALPVKVLLRLHYLDTTVDSVLALARRITSRFGDDARFSHYFKAVGRLGGPRDADLPIMNREDRAETERRLAAATGGMTPEQRRVASGSCYAGHPWSFVVRSDGSLSKCTVALYEPFNSIGRLNPDGTVEIDRDRLQPWISALLSGDPGDVACPLKRVGDAWRIQKGPSGFTVADARTSGTPTI